VYLSLDRHTLCSRLSMACVTADESQRPVAHRCQPNNAPAARLTGRLHTPYPLRCTAANAAAAPATAIPSPQRAPQPYRTLRKHASSAIAPTQTAPRTRLPGPRSTTRQDAVIAAPSLHDDGGHHDHAGVEREVIVGHVLGLQEMRALRHVHLLIQPVRHRYDLPVDQQVDMSL